MIFLFPPIARHTQRPVARHMARSLLISSVMNWLIPLVERLSQILTMLASVGLSDRSAHLELLRQTLIGNSLFFCIWASWEIAPTRTAEMQGGIKRISTAFVRRSSDQSGVEDVFEESSIIPTPVVSAHRSRPVVTLRPQYVHNTWQLLAGISAPIAKDKSGMCGMLGVDVVLTELAEDALLHPDRRTLELLATIERELQGALLVLTADRRIVGATPQALQRVEVLTGVACVRGERLQEELLNSAFSQAPLIDDTPVRKDIELPHCSFSIWAVPLSKKGRMMLFIQPSSLPDPPASPNQELSGREQEVLHCLAKGKSNAEIATTLGISSNTVKNHLDRVFKKLAVTNRHAAALAAFEKYSRA